MTFIFKKFQVNCFTENTKHLRFNSIMETNIFDIFTAIFIHTCGGKILKQLYLHTAFIRLLVVEACLFIEIVTVGTSYGGTFLADDMCKAMFSFIILSFVFIGFAILVCVNVALIKDPMRLKIKNVLNSRDRLNEQTHPGTDEDEETLALAMKISVGTKLLGFISGFFMFLYCYRLFDRYNADEILIIFTSIDFTLDFLEIILVILKTSGILAFQSTKKGSVGTSDGV